MQNSSNRIGLTRPIFVVGIGFCVFAFSNRTHGKAQTRPNLVPAREASGAAPGVANKAQNSTRTAPDPVTQDAATDDALEREYRARQSADKRAIDEIEAAGLKCRVKPLTDGELAQWARQNSRPPVDVVVAVFDTNLKATDDDLAPIGVLSDVTFVSLIGTRITDRGLRSISGLKKLRTLYLGDTEITDRGVAQIRDLTELRELWLRGTRVTDAALADLQNLTSLEHLLLDRTNVGDNGITHLQNMKLLKSLGLSKTQVTDAGLLRLTGLTNLKSLDLYDTKVTDEGVAMLRKALPKLTVQRKAPGFDFQAGPEDARQDIKSGKIRYLLYGQPQAHDALFGQILKADYGITLVAGGCTISEESRVQADGYNKVIHEHLKQRSKESVIKDAEAKARRLWDREHAEAQARH